MKSIWPGRIAREHRLDVRDDRVHVPDGGLHRLAAAEGEELVCELGAARRRRADRRDLVPTFLAPCRLEEAAVAEDDLQQVVEVVRDAAGELADRLEPLGVAEPFLCLGQLTFGEFALLERSAQALGLMGEQFVVPFKPGRGRALLAASRQPEECQQGESGAEHRGCLPDDVAADRRRVAQRVRGSRPLARCGLVHECFDLAEAGIDLAAVDAKHKARVVTVDRVEHPPDRGQVRPVEAEHLARDRIVALVTGAGDLVHRCEHVVDGGAVLDADLRAGLEPVLPLERLLFSDCEAGALVGSAQRRVLAHPVYGPVGDECRDDRERRQHQQHRSEPEARQTCRPTHVRVHRAPPRAVARPQWSTPNIGSGGGEWYPGSDGPKAPERGSCRHRLGIQGPASRLGGRSPSRITSG